MTHKEYTNIDRIKFQNYESYNFIPISPETWITNANERIKDKNTPVIIALYRNILFCSEIIVRFNPNCGGNNKFEVIIAYMGLEHTNIIPNNYLKEYNKIFPTINGAIKYATSLMINKEFMKNFVIFNERGNVDPSHYLKGPNSQYGYFEGKVIGFNTAIKNFLKQKSPTKKSTKNT